METEENGLGFSMAVIFLAGQMAGVGVIALPFAMVGTGRIYMSFHFHSGSVLGRVAAAMCVW